MHISITKLGFLTATVLATLSAANPNEAVLLANCAAPNDATFKSSYVAYYSNSGNQTPSTIAKVQTPPA